MNLVIEIEYPVLVLYHLSHTRSTPYGPHVDVHTTRIAPTIYLS